MSPKHVRKILIVANWGKKEAHSLSATIRSYIEAKGIECTIWRTTVEQDKPIVAEDTDLVICLGGDGTVLYCARHLQTLGVPILAINLGTFGYITEISVDEWKEAVDRFLDGSYTLSRRLMIRVGVYRKGERVFTAHGLNEIVVSSSGISKVIGMSLKVGETHAGCFRADGMIIATPTGSTAYSLAAGGPILDAELSTLLITPICPFTLSNRPLVLSGESLITLTISPGQRTGIVLSVDGQQNFALEEGDELIVEKSRSRTLLVTSEKRNYIEVLREKLNWAGGAAHA
ncbi:MAG: NAD(+)/NADH kinase [Spirochaetales bacterium]|nr:NAD(+)/NADH kinase [Spirochaetales bacterium]